MQNNFSKHKYWIAAGFVTIALIIILYPGGIYNKLTMEITRPQAIEIAKDFLIKQNIDVQGFYEEAILDNSPIEIKYILKTLGEKGFKKYNSGKKWSNLGWSVLFHQNLPRQIQQTQITVDVSSDGNIYGFKMKIPDESSLPSISKTEAAELISSYLLKKIGSEFNQYKLIESKEENYRNRTDHSFRWEKDETGLNAKIVITANITGNKISGYSQYFEVPQKEREYIEAIDAIYGTVSVIFLIFLMFIAIFLFLKKYHQGEIWISVGRSFFILYFILSFLYLTNLWPALGFGAQLGELSFLNIRIMIFLIYGLIINFFMALLVFTSWTVGESYARSLWPHKLKGIDAFIKGHFYTLDSGASIMKGFVIGSALSLCYLAAELFLDQPGAKIFISPTNFYESLNSFIPGMHIIFNSLTTSFLAAIAVTFFIVNISYQRWKNKRLSIMLSGLVTTLGYIIASTPPSVNNFIVNLFVGFLFGCGIAYIYFLFDLLTILSLHFYSAVISNAFSLYSSHNTFFSWNFIIVLVVLLAAPALYILSRIKKEEFELKNYGLPSHVQRISERERLKKEMEIAAKVQLSLLPKEEPKIPGYEIASVSIPAVEAGGDYFDFVKLSNNKMGIAIGDVSGKGVGAAIYMTLTKGILQAHAEEDASPRNVLGKVNRLLYKTIEKNSFVSMFYAILDVNNNKILYSRAGHNPGILCSQTNGETKLLLGKGMALGLEEGSIFTSTLHEEEIEIKQGDVFVLYTDGFTEAMNFENELYGEERLINLIKNNRNLSSHDLLSLVLKDVEDFVKDYAQHDDMTMLIVKRV
jgi:phosphoserine phosphatase RsbU/P